MACFRFACGCNCGSGRMHNYNTDTVMELTLHQGGPNVQRLSQRALYYTQTDDVIMATDGWVELHGLCRGRWLRSVKVMTKSVLVLLGPVVAYRIRLSTKRCNRRMEAILPLVRDVFQQSYVKSSESVFI